ncbi:MAG: hypothetical protein MAG715_00371 [Methanonatronarchaeales archaeon]|nr:hypothetical protein [Methanonatronarchaeales archaeon]
MLRLEVYVGESDRGDGGPLWKTVLRRLQERGVAGASVFRGVAGYGAAGEIHSLDVLRLSEDMPVLVVAVDDREKIESAASEMESLVDEGLVLLQRVRGSQRGRDGQ